MDSLDQIHISPPPIKGKLRDISVPQSLRMTLWLEALGDFETDMLAPI